MRFTEIYEHVLPYWGLEIDFSDGEIIDIGDDETGFFSARLSHLWNKVEEEVGYENSYYELMVWTMYQVFHQKARALFEEDKYFLLPAEISPWEIEEQYFNNLKAKIWERERRDYLRD
jgi:hypothetical protein